MLIKLNKDQAKLYKTLKAEFEENSVIQRPDGDQPIFDELVRLNAIFHTARNFYRLGMEVQLPADDETDPETLDWGRPVLPVSPKSQSKGPYWIAKEDTSNPAYLRLKKILEDAIKQHG
jgi:hypothetical protein